MRQLKPDETPRPGDWFFVFGMGAWIQLDESPKPFFRMTIGQADAENKRPHFPIVMVRPSWLERIFGTPPRWKPNQHQIRKNRRLAQ